MRDDADLQPLRQCADDEPARWSRRAVLRAIGATAAAAALPAARAAEWPERPVRMLVGYPAGGANDLVARAVAPRLSETLKQSVLVENRTGAAGTIAADVVARSPADGYTLYMMSSAQVLAPHVRKDVSFDPVKDFTAIALCAEGPYLLVVHKDVPARNVAEFVALAKSRSLNYASSGVGAGPHLTSSLFMTVAGIQMNHVPYRGDADAVVDLTGGRVDAAFMSVQATYPHVKSGALRALATSGAQRVPLLPDVPAVAEAGYSGFEMTAWWGLVGPARLPQPIVEKAHAAVRPILESDAFAAQFAAMGVTPGRLGPQQFARRIADDHAKFADIVKRAGITPQ
ncbi:MAG TPA: tripartite tricarboxylate transporter substrate binding protein [Burkholderiaceae bacterium]|nr:tripartite tricarboxylate transporter substrate binding protein [Burkholderiaceae bacterium]